MKVPKYVPHKQKRTKHTTVNKKGQQDLSYDEKVALKGATLDTLHHLKLVDKHFCFRVQQGVAYLDKNLAQDALYGKFTPVELVQVESYNDDGELTFKDSRVLIQMDREVEMAYRGRHADYRILNHVYYVVSLTRKSMVTGYVSESNKLKRSRKGLI